MDYLNQLVGDYAYLWERLLPYLQQMNEGLREGWTPLTLLILQIIAGLLALVVLLVSGPKRHRIKWGKRKMTRPEREAEERGLIGDGLTDVLEELVYKGRMSLHRKNIWQQRFANILNLPDLLPQKLVKTTDILGRDIVVGKRKGKTLKEAIKDRLSNGANKPVPLPDRKVGLKDFMATRKLSPKVASK